ncbi:hypothetical protein FKW44_009411 [Caligus rogercresseyi]|uniref:Uncharacterized protein n=1 Tax=Caligus rogercresseyi TaxID=217165 RepID=A0A7T8HF37_CALRO|nr:hypothetical protein FKW44_009411 [Caligus rogercresseyi]
MVLEEEECPWPFIHPVKQKKGGGERGEDYADEEKPPKYQSVLSMQMNEWEDLKEYFGTKEPLIDHEVFLSREKEEGKKRARR